MPSAGDRLSDRTDLIGVLDTIIGRHAVRNWGSLESALARPAASAFGQDAYSDLWTKTAAPPRCLARNRALADGNKRTAWLATLLMPAENGHRIAGESPEAEADFVEAVARGDVPLNEIAATRRSWDQP